MILTHSKIVKNNLHLSIHRSVVNENSLSFFPEQKNSQSVIHSLTRSVIYTQQTNTFRKIKYT